MRQLATLVLRSENVGRLVGDKAHHHDDRENMKWFVLQLTRLDERANYYVHDTTTDPHEPHQIVTFEIVGRISWEQTELRFDVVDIDGRSRHRADPVAGHGRSVGRHAQGRRVGRRTDLVANNET